MNIDTNVNFDIDTDELVGEMESDIARIAVENADDIVREAESTIDDIVTGVLSDYARTEDVEDIARDTMRHEGYLTSDDLDEYVRTDDVENIARDAADSQGYITRDDLDDLVSYDGLGSRIGDEIESMLDNMPSDYNGRCSLGRSFSAAVYACVRDIIEATHEDAVELRADLAAAVGTNVTVTASGDVTVALASDDTATDSDVWREQFAVVQLDAYGKTVGIFGPFDSREDAQVCLDGNAAYRQCVPMARYMLAPQIDAAVAS